MKQNKLFRLYGLKNQKQVIEKLHNCIEQVQPKTMTDLYQYCRGFLDETSASIKVTQINFMGSVQGCKVRIRWNNKQYTLPGQGKVYSVFK